ncbi:MAG: ParB/RepB/Spo0J family partition protein [Candidatus Kapaibacteriota bacterium]
MKIETVPISSLVPNPNNIRTSVGSDEEIEMLANNIRDVGLLNPIVVVPFGDKYMILAGNRRFAAIQMLGWKEVPVIIRSDISKDNIIIAVSENCQRKDISIRETINAIRVMYDEMRMDIEDISNVFGRSISWTKNMVRLLDAPNEAIDAVDKYNVPIGVILELIRIDDGDVLLQWIDYAIRWGISISEAKRMVDYYYINRDAIVSPNSEFNPEVMKEYIEKIYIDCFLCGSKIEIGDAKIIRICPNCLADLNEE